MKFDSIGTGLGVEGAALDITLCRMCHHILESILEGSIVAPGVFLCAIRAQIMAIGSTLSKVVSWSGLHLD